MRTSFLMLAVLGAAVLAGACGDDDGGSRDAAGELNRLDGYESGTPALVFVYTDG